MSDKGDLNDEDLSVIVTEYKKLGETEQETARKSVESFAEWIAERFEIAVVKAYQIIPDLMTRLSLMVP